MSDKRAVRFRRTGLLIPVVYYEEALVLNDAPSYVKAVIVPEAVTPEALSIQRCSLIRFSAWLETDPAERPEALAVFRQHIFQQLYGRISPA